MAGLRPGRKPEKINRLAATLRLMIVQGKWSPGHRLPTRLRIGKTHRASSDTVQAAMDQLAHEALVEPRGRNGTFVASFPPHLHHYILAHPYSPDDPVHWSSFWQTLLQQTSAFSTSPNRRITFLSRVNGRPDEPSMQRLTLDAQRRRVRGIIFCGPIVVPSDSPILAAPHLGRVVIGSAPQGHVPAIYADLDSFLRRAVEYLARRGRKRLALVSIHSPDEPWFDSLRAAAKQSGLTLRPYWHQVPNRVVPLSISHALWAIARRDLPPEERPDAFLITDDNLVEHATQGLVLAGLRFPHDADVVAHCNFPHPPAAHTPVQFLGFDTTQLLHECLRLIDLQHQAQTPPPLTLLPAVFPHEVAPPRNNAPST